MQKCSPWTPVSDDYKFYAVILWFPDDVASNRTVFTVSHLLFSDILKISNTVYKEYQFRKLDKR